MRMQLCFLDYNNNVLVNDFQKISRCVATRGDHGDETIELTARLSVYAAARLYAYRGYLRVMLLYGGWDAVWDGRVDSKAIRGRDIDLVAEGHWAALGDLPYTALWSTSDVSVWEPLTEAHIATVTSNKYRTDTNNRLYISPNRGQPFVSGDHGGHYFLAPDGGRRNPNVIMFSYKLVAGQRWTSRLRSFATAAFGSPTTLWSFTPSSYGTVTGARFHTFSSAPALAIDLVSNYPAGKTLGTAINEVSTTLAPSTLQVNTTSGTAVVAPGSFIITPASMTNIVTGLKLLYGSNTSTLEKVTVTATTATTFTATFKTTHASGVAIKSVDNWAVPEVDTTTTGAHNAGAVTITPASMANIVSGMKLIIGWGGEAEEEITVSSVTTSTFNCTLVYGHASGEKIKNGANSYTVRPNSMTGIITGMNLEIGGRNSEIVYVTATTATTFTATFRYGHPGGSGVGTAEIQGVTPSSITGVSKGQSWQVGNNGGATNSEEEITEISLVSGSLFVANFKTPHSNTDSLRRVFKSDFDVYLEITDLRVATSTTYMVNTTIGSSITAGVRVVTPADMSHIYVGQKLYIAGVGSNGEIVTVTAITSTTFTATFALDHTATVTVQGIVVCADEVVEDVVSMHQAEDNPQISSSTGLVESPGYDLVDCWYEDEYPIDFLPSLAEKGDGDAPYQIGVSQDRKLFLRPRGTSARDWIVDIALDELSLETARSAVRNSAYGVFRTAEGRFERTADASDSASIALHGVTRRAPVNVDTISESQAERERDNYLAQYANPEPRSTISFDQLYSPSRARALLHQLKPGDTMTAGNMPLGLLLQTGGIDPLAWQTLRRVYDLVEDKMSIEPRTPVRTTQNVLAKGVQLSRAAVDIASKSDVGAKGRKLSQRLSRESRVI